MPGPKDYAGLKEGDLVRVADVPDTIVSPEHPQDHIQPGDSEGVGLKGPVRFQLDLDDSDIEGEGRLGGEGRGPCGADG